MTCENPQQTKLVTSGYTVTALDQGWVLLALGTINLPAIPGLYVSVINERGGTVQFTPRNGVPVRSLSGATALTTINQSTTLLCLPTGQWFAFGL